jgi:hypothetical protein
VLGAPLRDKAARAEACKQPNQSAALAGNPAELWHDRTNEGATEAKQLAQQLNATPAATR